MDHDRLFKELVSSLFIEFLDLFCPEVAAYIERDSLVLLDKEIFTDVTSGDRHEVDLLARVNFKDSPACFLILAEGQAKSQQKAYPKRIFRYFARIDEKFDLPVYPIVVFTFDAPKREEPNTYSVDFPDFHVLDFHFRTIQLNRLNWRDFVNRPNPVAAALMSKMGMAEDDRPAVKLACLRMLATLKLDPARTQLISGFVDSYLKLNAQEMEQFRTQLDTETPQAEKEGVMQIMTSWKEEGIKEGIQEGTIGVVKRQLKRKFGSLDPVVQSRIEALPGHRVEELVDALLDFNSPNDLAIWLQAHG